MAGTHFCRLKLALNLGFMNKSAFMINKEETNIIYSVKNINMRGIVIGTAIIILIIKYGKSKNM